MAEVRYAVYATETFKEVYVALDGSERRWVDKIMEQLQQNPTGKILHFEWFREKKFLNKRLFYLIDEGSMKILFVAFATKKEQQSIIEFVVTNKEELLLYLRSL